jgi:O-antigen ligase
MLIEKREFGIAPSTSQKEKAKARFYTAEKIGIVFFAFFLFAGHIKLLPQLSFIQSKVDLTVLLFFLSTLLGLQNFLASKGKGFAVGKMGKVIFGIYLLFCLWLIIGLFYTPSQVYGYTKVFRFVILTTWATVGGFFLMRNTQSLFFFFWIIFIFSLAMTIDALIKLPTLNPYSHLSAFATSYIGVGRDLGLGIIALLFIILPKTSGRLAKVLLVLVLLMQLFVLIRSAARGPIIALLITIVVFALAWIYRTARIPRKLSQLLVVLSSLLLVMLSIFPILEKYQDIVESIYLYQPIRRFNLLEEASGESFAIRKGFIFEKAPELINRSPILGHGPGSFPIYTGMGDVRGYPHNIFVEIFVENGLIGLLIFLTLLYFTLRYTMSTYSKYANGIQSKIILNVLLASFIFYFINANFSGDINDNQLLFCFIGLLAISKRFLNYEP